MYARRSNGNATPNSVSHSLSLADVAPNETDDCLSVALSDFVRFQTDDDDDD